MRHLGSLFLSLILGPVIWVLTGVGSVRQGPVALDLSALLIAGALYGILVLSRLSPIGPALVGFAYLAAAGWAALDLDALRQTVPAAFAGVDQALVRPAEGIAALLAVPLVATVLQGRRWRRYDRVAALYAGGPPQPSYPPAYPAPEPDETTVRLTRP